MNNLDSNLEQNRKLLFEIADALKDKGYRIAESLSGRRVEEPRPSHSGIYGSMGILVRATPKLLGIIPIPFVEEWAYPATLWIDNGLRGATPNERWVLDVFGNENMDNSQKLMQQIAEPYNVEVAAGVYVDKLRWEGQALEWPELERQAR